MPATACRFDVTSKHDMAALSPQNTESLKWSGRHVLGLFAVVLLCTLLLVCAVRHMRIDRFSQTASQRLLHHATLEWSISGELTSVSLRPSFSDDVNCPRSIKGIVASPIEYRPPFVHEFSCLSDQLGLRRFDAGENRLIDEDLDFLINVDYLEQRNLSETDVTDATLSRLHGLSSLRVLSLRGTQITDYGVSQLTTFKLLRSMDLSDTCVTDACLPGLVSMKQLKYLWIDRTTISYEGKEFLWRELPELLLIEYGGRQETIGMRKR